MSNSPAESTALAAIKFAVEAADGIAFLRAWLHGDFPEIRRDWPEAPAAVFVGAEPAVPPGSKLDLC